MRPVLPFWRELGAGLLELALPERCAACERRIEEGAALCGACCESLEPVGPAVCARCGEPLPLPDAPVVPRRCSRCRRAPPAFLRARAPYLYGGELARAITRCKFGARPELCRPLGRLLAPPLGALAARLGAAPAPLALVPVPLHPRRLRQRQFNQALLLARAAVATVRRAGTAVPAPDAAALVRVRHTPPQIGLTPAARAANVAGAFRAVPRRIAGRAVVLVDDVLTTGATADACARALRAAGAVTVEVLTLARAAP